eukprot:Gb_28953 [translate_table: standard]
MVHLKKEDPEAGQSEGLPGESHAPDEIRGGDTIDSTSEMNIINIGHVAENACGGLPQIHPRSLNVSVSCTTNVLDERNCSVVDCIPPRSVTHLTSLIGFSGSAACSSNYVHGGRILGKARAVALQVPASPLHEPSLTGSAVAASVVHVATTSRSFFPPLGSVESRSPEGGFGHCAVASSVVDCTMPAEPRVERSGGQNGDDAGMQSENERRHASIAQRLTDVLQGRGDGDLLLQQTDRENGMLQWLQALDLQVMGACRADERLRPMLQLNVSCSGADDRLLAHLSQFECISRVFTNSPSDDKVNFRNSACILRHGSLGCWHGACVFHLFQYAWEKLLSKAVYCAQPLQVEQPVAVGMIRVKIKAMMVDYSKPDCYVVSRHLKSHVRGHLSLTLLPSSDLRLSFVGDNGGVERLAILSPGNENSIVVIEEISADTSGRSFLLKLPGGKLMYFWQSEKSKLVGDELLSKMKDLLGRRPSLAQLTGIRESRLDSFATYLRNSLLGSSSSSQRVPFSSSPSVSMVSSTDVVSGQNTSSNASAPFLRPSQRFRLAVSQAMAHGRFHSGNQGSLSPRAGAFKDGLIRNVSCIRTVVSARERVRKRVDVHSNGSVIGSPTMSAVQTSRDSQNFNGNGIDLLSTRISLSVTGQNAAEVASHSAGLYTSIDASYEREHGLGWEHSTPLPQRYLHLPVSLPISSGNGLPSQQSLPVGESSFNPLSFHLPVSSRVPIASSSIFAPYYCRCPLRTSSLQYTITPPFLPSVATEAVSLPPSTSYFSVGSSSTFIPPLPLDLRDVSFSPIPLPVPSLVSIPTPLQTPNLPAFLTDPVVRIPLPVSSFVTVPTPQQISSFTPFFSDPIVHIPVIDFHSSGQGYLVSAGPSISSSISPILPSLLTTFIPESGPLVEKEDANTLQLLSTVGFSSSWGGSEVGSCQMAFKSGFPSETSRATAISRPLSEHQSGLGGFCNSNLGAQSSLGGGESLYDLCRGVRSSSSSIQNLVHYSIPSQQSGPLVGMVPAVLTSSSLSCFYDICQDGKTKSTTLVTGSRGLYGGSCDLSVSSNRLAGTNVRNTINGDINLNCAVKNSANGTHNIEMFLQMGDEAFSDKESSMMEETHEENSGTE